MVIQPAQQRLLAERANAGMVEVRASYVSLIFQADRGHEAHRFACPRGHLTRSESPLERGDSQQCRYYVVDRVRSRWQRSAEL